MNIILADSPLRKKFYPLTLTRPIADIRIGIFTIRERWERLSGLKVFVLTEPYLQSREEEIPPGKYLVINPCMILIPGLADQILALEMGQAISSKGEVLAFVADYQTTPSYPIDFNVLSHLKIEVDEIETLDLPCNIFQQNEKVLHFDFNLLKSETNFEKYLQSNTLINSDYIFIEDGAEISGSILNASTGPIYIAKGATIMEGCLIRGPFAMCEGATLKMGSKVYGATTLGPYCVGGGEIKNSVMMGFSNKAHDGYLGDSVIGEWCNLGAGTSNSNVKNTASDVKVWNFYENEFISVGIKCGLLMGDYSRTSINTSINTGTVMGVCCNVFGESLTPKVIPNFTWGTKELSRYELDKAFKDIANWKKMKNKTYSDEDRNILRYIFDNYND